MKILETNPGYCDADVYGVVVRFQLGTGKKTYGAYVDLLRNEDVLNSAIEATDEESTLPFQLPPAFQQQVLKAAIAFKHS